MLLPLICLVLPGSRLKAQAQSTNASVVEIEGKTLLARAGNDTWTAAKVGDTLFPGDRFRTLERSRAVIRLSDLSLLRLGQSTYIQIPPPTNRRGGLQMLRGILYYFHRDKPGVMPITAPSAHAVVRGTEFIMTVADDGSSQITMVDGVVEFTNEFGRLNLSSGQSGQAQIEAAPALEVQLDASTRMQWMLHYPPVVHLADLQLEPGIGDAISESLSEFQSGDLHRALASYPANREPAAAPEKVYVASLELCAGQAARATALLNDVIATESPESPAARAAIASLRLVAIVNHQRFTPLQDPVLPVEWLVESYARQARSDLPGALAAATHAIDLAPDFSFAHAQVAALAFGFGQARAARAAVERSRNLAPRHARAIALHGWIRAADFRFTEAIAHFDEAIGIDGSLGEAWLGRGLCRIRSGALAEGRADLQTAVLLEPRRAVYRSYLAKAYTVESDAPRAQQEIKLSKRIDPLDPTAWLYSALLNQEQNQINQGIADLEHSKALNDQRAVFRSRLLLDQDRAIRGANLASLYRDAGMSPVGVREASDAVAHDYTSHSAHSFLAGSFNALRDPNLVQLRYETPAVSEYLMAGLLAPVGASPLSPFVSQQEYSPLFERNRIGITSDTLYTSDGGWSQSGAVHGTADEVGYALEGSWRHTPGHRRNSDLDQRVASGHFKLQLSPRTSAYLLTSVARVESGDVRPYYDDREASRHLRLMERQEPNVFAGVHHQWSPGIHTLFLGAHWNDTVDVREPQAAIRTLVRDSSGTLTDQVAPNDSVFGLRYHSVFKAWSAELQQIFQTPRHLFILGARGQTGEFETRATLSRDPFAFPPVYTDPADSGNLTESLDRASLYAYWNWQVTDPLRLIVGGSYGRLRAPSNVDAPPIQRGNETRNQVSPKAGFLWTPLSNTTVRGAYSRTLGGTSFDQSVRLEPTQISGFIQSYRSLIPESESGLVPGTRFETFHLGLDHKFPTRTYLVAHAEWLRSEGHREVGIFDYTDAPPFLAEPSALRQNLDFDERTLGLSLHQLLADEWGLSAAYRVSRADFESRYPALPETIDPNARLNETALLHQLDLTLLYNHSSGFFGRGEALWRRQDNQDDDPALRDEDFCQFNLWAGWRISRRRVEISAGLLNITDRSYRLDPLNLANALPRERMLVTRLRWSF